MVCNAEPNLDEVESSASSHFQSDKFNCHSVSVGFLTPLHKISSSLETIIDVLVRVTVHPASLQSGDRPDRLLPRFLSGNTSPLFVGSLLCGWNEDGSCVDFETRVWLQIAEEMTRFVF